jgi:hypothetical protein
VIRFAAAGFAALLLASAGVFVWQAQAQQETPLPAAPQARRAAPLIMPAAIAAPPEASTATREEKRFGRYDKDRNGVVSREEYLASRRKAWAKLDTDGDGRLSFDEWAAKSTAKFGSADGDKSGLLTAAEFATTRVARKPRAGCPPVAKDDET